MHCYLIMLNAMTTVSYFDWMETNTSVFEDISIEAASSVSNSFKDWFVSSCYLSSLSSRPLDCLVRKFSLDPWTVWVRNDAM
jgi:hypothetical protein